MHMLVDSVDALQLTGQRNIQEGRNCAEAIRKMRLEGLQVLQICGHYTPLSKHARSGAHAIAGIAVVEVICDREIGTVYRSLVHL